MLETAWFVLWGLTWAVYFMLDGFDLGVGALLPFTARDEAGRRQAYNAIGPFWDGNEVWLVTAGGVTFAAFPGAYAVMFSALYAPLIMLLFALILRGAALGLRFESESAGARRAWDAVFFAGSLAASFLFGAFFADLFKGVPIGADGAFHGTILDLLSPYALLGGALFTASFIFHGLVWLCLKSDGELKSKAEGMALMAWAGIVVTGLAFDAGTVHYTRVWEHLSARPMLLLIPAANVVSAILAGWFTLVRSWLKAWISSAVFIVSLVFYGLAGIYPALLPSSLDPAFSLTVANSASSTLTLEIMLGVAIVFLPLVVAYQGWVFYIFRGKAESGGGYGHGR